MDAGIIISSLIEKSKIDSTRVQTRILKHLRRLLKEFLITDAEDNQAFVQGHSTSEQKIARLLQAVYSAEDCIDTWLTRRESQRLYELSGDLFLLSIDLLEDDRFETKSEELLKENEELLKEREELLKEREEFLRESEEFLRENKELQLQRGSVKNCRKRVENCIDRVKNCIERVRNFRNRVENCRERAILPWELKNYETLQKEGEILQKDREISQKEREISEKDRERLQKDREILQKKRERLQKKREGLQSDRDKIFKKDFKQLSMWFTPLFCHNNIISTGEMKELENEVKGLCCQIENEGGVGYSFQTNFENYRAWERISDFCLKEETDVVGVEQQTEELLAWLIPKPDGADGGQYAQIIGVVGEEGSGKTTLARSVYNRVDVKQHFTQRAWVHASSVLESRDVFIDILNQIHPDGFFLEVTISDEEVMLKLTQLLESTRHLIVIDDIETDQVSQSLQYALCSSSSHGSRIIITTRTELNLPQEAAHPDGFSPRCSLLHVNRLNRENRWKLFSKKVLSEAEDESELTKLKEQILNLSGISSLQLVMLGSLLSTKQRSYDEWSKVIERAITNFRGNMLALSYQDLPPQVKPCFLYLMLFPRAFEIPVRRLIHLWCAEGFTTSFDSHDQDIVPEDVAEMYFEELVIRNLIQVTRWRLDGRPKSCRIPRVVYDAFCQKASDLGFVYNPDHSSHTSTQSVVRRLSLSLNVIKFHTSYHPHHLRHIRSYVAFDSQIRGTGTKGIEFFLKSSISNRGFCLLKVLDLEGVYKPKIGYDVWKKLLRLRYIGLRSTFIEYIPYYYVGNLPDLETLDLKHTYISDILCRVRRAEKLQHLYLNWINEDWSYRKVYLPLLKNLRTLWGLRLSGEFRQIGDLSKLTCLRKLGLKFEKNVSRSTIFEWVSQLSKLQSLKLGCLEKEYSPGLLKIAEHYKLNDLYLGGRLLPQKSEELLNFFPPNLRKLTLSLSEIHDDPMRILGELPHLNILRLFADSYMGKQITSRGFPKLHVLKLWKLQVVESWTVEEGAMPCLRETEIRSCKKLTSIEGLQNVTTLKEIVLTNMPSESHSLPHHENTSIKINEWRNSPP